MKTPIKEVGDAVEKLGEAIDENVTSVEEKMTKHNEAQANARELQKSALEQEDNFSKRAIHYLAYFWSAVAALYIFAVSFLPVPTDNTRVVDTVTGFLLGTIVAGIITFYFGSSYSSSVKTKQTDGLIGRLLNKKR